MLNVIEKLFFVKQTNFVQLLQTKKILSYRFHVFLLLYDQSVLFKFNCVVTM